MNYKINGSGSVSTIISRPDGSLANLFCPEAPEILFQDYGSGQLINGTAHIELDPIFANAIYVSEDHPLRVSFNWKAIAMEYMLIIKQKPALM
jgi:hypothetical protein